MRNLNTQWMHPRNQIIMIIDKIYEGGLTTTSGGNISIIDDNGDVWVTPSAIDKGTLRTLILFVLKGWKYRRTPQTVIRVSVSYCHLQVPS